MPKAFLAFLTITIGSITVSAISEPEVSEQKFDPASYYNDTSPSSEEVDANFTESELKEIEELMAEEDQEEETFKKTETSASEKQTIEFVKESDDCHPSYSGCLNPNAGDYDCSGGSGNGPNYTGAVQVYGSDPFDLDRDNDGLGCE